VHASESDVVFENGTAAAASRGIGTGSAPIDGSYWSGPRHPLTFFPMPIRLNLLAEAQAAEDMRRRDPVKRAGWIGVLLICLMLVWSSSLQMKAIILSNQVSHAESAVGSFTNEYRQVQANQHKIDDINFRLTKLQALSTNRFLQANALNALQRTIVDNVQLLHLKMEQSYVITDEVKAHTNDNRVIPGKPATATERITVVLEGSDSSRNPGDQVLIYKEAISTNDWFRLMTGRPNAVALKSLSPPSMDMGRPTVFFNLECRFPEVTR
jgi:hypothetical protein